MPAKSRDIERVGIECFVGQGNPDEIEFSQGMLALERVKRDTMQAHGSFHICPGGVGALSQRVGTLIHLVIQDRQPQIGHPQIINIREHQRQMSLHAIPILDNLVQLTAGIAARFLDSWQDAFEAGVDLEGRQHR